MKNFSIFILFLSIISFVSCDLECDTVVDFEEETRVEKTSWKAAETTYNAEPTEENCVVLTDASERYVESLNGVRDCVSTFDLEDFLDTLSFLEEEGNSRCN